MNNIINYLWKLVDKIITFLLPISIILTIETLLLSVWELVEIKELEEMNYNIYEINEGMRFIKEALENDIFIAQHEIKNYEDKTSLTFVFLYTSIMIIWCLYS